MLCNVVYAYQVARMEPEQRVKFDEWLSTDPVFERKAAALLKNLETGEGI